MINVIIKDIFFASLVFSFEQEIQPRLCYKYSLLRKVFPMILYPHLLYKYSLFDMINQLKARIIHNSINNIHYFLMGTQFLKGTINM